MFPDSASITLPSRPTSPGPRTSSGTRTSCYPFSCLSYSDVVQATYYPEAKSLKVTHAQSGLKLVRLYMQCIGAGHGCHAV